MRPKLIRTGALALCFALALLAVYGFSNATNTRLLAIHVFDVGQGDGILITTPYHQNIVVDGGPDDVFGAKLGATLPFYDRTIDILLLTHPHADHVTGLVNILKQYTVHTVFLTKVLHEELPAYQEFLQEIAKRHIASRIVRDGTHVNLGSDLSIDILAPSHDLAHQTVRDLNDSSIVAMLNYNILHVLLMGDAGTNIEHGILAAHPTLQADIIKVGHHGSKHSSGEDFLKAVRPKLGVISVGLRNRYGHPHATALKAFQALGIPLLRTDQDGDIEIDDDGKTITVIPEKNHHTLILK